jgi:nucleotide-binding universal stress UspA family protein
MTEIVVGVDGSKGAARAVAWAVDEAVARGWSVTALLAWSYLDQRHADGKERFEAGYGEADASAALDAYLRAAIGAERAAGVQRIVVNDLAAPALLDAAANAALLVVGARGLGGFLGLRVGSVSEHCLHHAPHAVAVVHDADGPRGGTMERIVVGIDGSDTSRHALRWAIDEARAHDASLQVVHAWHVPYGGGSPFAYVAVDPTLIEDAARKVLDAAIDAEDTSGLRQPVERTLVQSGAASAVLDAAKDADLVVVGSRGLGGFSGLLLGSVSQQVAHHATAPVVIVPEEG